MQRPVEAGAKVTAIDNMITGADNVDHLLEHGQFRLVDYDVTDYLHVKGGVHYAQLRLAASPVDYLQWPIHLKVGRSAPTRGWAWP